jgi:MYXO-CTERM domain-containing protein
MKTMMLFAAAALCAAVAPAIAQMPQMGGPMIHADVAFDGSALSVAYEGTGPVSLLTYGQSYANQFAVLDGTYYNAQIGWRPAGTISLPTDRFVWIEVLDQSAGLMTYEGGRMNNMMAQTMNPLFGTGGSDTKWRWGGLMTHNWYAVTDPGDYSATYRVYLGDGNGAMDTAYAAAEVTFTWTAVPAPSAAGLLAFGGLVATRRRRTA